MGAERFLRQVIDPTETSKVVLTETPSAMVDGAALAAWKAGGETSAPHFFSRTKRETQPAPPVEIAILVDISSSMSVLQRPSAWLSWAMASAALDLRNFAGRGTQVSSCLIHWGYSVNVIQAPGQVLPGIREVPCTEGTTAMNRALGEVENQLPGFFEASDKPSNRLLVQFTDWELYGGQTEVVDILTRGFDAGVKMLSVVPRGFALSWTYRAVGHHPNARMLKYDPSNPAAVWESAAETLI